MSTLITLSIKQQDGKYKNYTISVYDTLDQYGNNVAMYEEQTKEERESKAKKKYLGNGRVVWTNGIVEVAPKKSFDKQIEKVQEEQKPISVHNGYDVTSNFVPVDSHNSSTENNSFVDIDDLPF
jgi:hypothetical protein